jgi:uncharacterized protein (TIGR02246 family)
MNMRTRLVTLVFVACASFSAAAEEGPESVSQAWRKAIMAGDIDALVACYASDAIGWFPDAPPVKGKDAIRQMFAAMLQKDTVKVDFANTHYHACGSDMAVGWGEYTITVTPKAGGSGTTVSGRFSEALKKEGGKWVYAMDHASAHPATSAKP